MKIGRYTLLVGILCINLFAVTNANAALESRLGGQAVYDTDLNLTWLADANLAATNTFGVSGIWSGGWVGVNDGSGVETLTWMNAGSMAFYTAIQWINAMNTNNYLGYHDWRLPDTLLPDPSCGYNGGSQPTGYNCLGSEMGHLFYNELGGVAGSPITNAPLFQNIQTNNYWSELYICTATPCPMDTAWIFDFSSGSQGWASTSNFFTIFPQSAWVVRDGDVTTVPVPAAFWLLGSGLVGLAGITRKCKAA